MADENIEMVTVWVSGTLNGTHYDCLGPITVPKSLGESGWPYVTVKPNPDFTYQKFNYLDHVWENMSEESQAQKIEDMSKSQKVLATQVTNLTKTISTSQIASTQENKETAKKLDDIQTSQQQLGANVTQLTKMLSQMMMAQAKPAANENGGNQ